MSKLSDIRESAARLARRRENGRNVDQEQARIERAKQEARREAKRERTQRRAQQAREQERQRVLNEEPSNDGLFSSVASTLQTATAAVADGDGERTDDVRRAMGTDFDGDGEPLAEELGLQSAARADAEDRKLGAIEDLANDNANRISTVENDLDAMSPQSGRRGGGRGGGRDGGQQRDRGRRSPPDLDVAPDEFDVDPIGEDELFGGGGL